MRRNAAAALDVSTLPTLDCPRIHDRSAADQLREGWSRGLESLKAHLEKTS